MAAFVVDASLVASWCFPDERTTYTEAVLDAVSNASDVVAPRLWAYEVHNSVLIGLRRNRITSAHAKAFLEDLRSFRIRLTDPLSYRNVFALADRYVLTVYDAAYLDIAIREGLPLASLDKKLVSAATDSGVHLLQV